MRSGMLPGSWQHQMKLQLFLKASKAYYVLSEAATNLQKYGRALRYIKLSLQCHGERAKIEKNTLISAQVNIIVFDICYDLTFNSFSPLCVDAYCAISSGLHPTVLLFHSQCVSLCGDVQLMLAQNASNRAAYLEEYSYQTRDDQEILHCLHRESSCQGFPHLSHFINII